MKHSSLFLDSYTEQVSVPIGCHVQSQQGDFARGQHLSQRRVHRESVARQQNRDSVEAQPATVLQC